MGLLLAYLTWQYPRAPQGESQPAIKETPAPAATTVPQAEETGGVADPSSRPSSPPQYDESLEGKGTAPPEEASPSEVLPEPSSGPRVTINQDNVSLITFAVRPTDAAIYLDKKFLGISENMTQGVRVSRGKHLLTIARYGFQSHEAIVEVEDSPLVVEVELRRANSISQSQESSEPAVQSQRADNLEPVSIEPLAGVRVYLRYRPRREIAALAIEERLRARGINVEVQEDVAPYGDKWNRIYYSECRQEAAQALVKIIGELLNVELVRSPAACGQTLEVVLFS